MNIHVVGLRRSEMTSIIREQYPTLHLDAKKPQVVICYGGDGTVLYGERAFPGIPKVMIRNSQICAPCEELCKKQALDLLSKKQFNIVANIKLEARCGRFRTIGLNDIVIGHPGVSGTMRAKIYINGRLYRREFLGDGVVIATTLGTTGYYQSITSSNFFSGIGIAFNNAITLINHLVVPEETAIDVEVTRGPARLVADNDAVEKRLATGDRVHIQKSRASARLVVFPQQYDNINLLNNLNRMPLGYCQVCRRVYTEE